MATPGSATTSTSTLRTSSIDSSGRIRQLTTACASAGSAFTRVPPASVVATQVVRRVAPSTGFCSMVCKAPCGTAPFAAAAARSAAASAGGSTAARAAK